MNITIHLFVFIAGEVSRKRTFILISGSKILLIVINFGIGLITDTDKWEEFKQKYWTELKENTKVHWFLFFSSSKEKM